MYLLVREDIERAPCLILDGSKLSNVNKCAYIADGREHAWRSGTIIVVL